MRVVGHRVRPLDWDAKTSGSARYAADVLPAGTLSGRILRSPVASADLSHVDVSRARSMTGVHAVITADDFPVGVQYEHSGGAYSDRAPLAVGRVDYVGHEIAAVAADSVEAAEAALRAISVRYRRRPAVLSIDAALADGAPRVHERESGTNVAVEVTGVWGDQELAARNSVHSVDGTFWYPRVTHACMEPNVTLAWWHDEMMELWTSTQAPHFVVYELARVLNLNRDQVRCRDLAVGGGFGSKSKVSEHEAIAAMLSMRCGRPVLLAFDRAEEIAATKPRHAFRTAMRVHCDGAGRLTWFEADVLVDNGAFNHYGPSVMRAGIKQIGSLYRPDAVTFSGKLIDTNLTPGGQFRGYGAPQTAIAMECLVDELAEQVGLDPIDFRIQNANEPNSVALAGSRIGSARLVECLETARKEIDWDTKRATRVELRGLGVAVGIHGSGSFAYPGSDVSAAGVEVRHDGTVVVRFGGADAGTGQRTVLGQIAAEVLGVDLDRVEVIMTDWDQTPEDMGAWSSRGTHWGGHATKQAAEAVAERLRQLGAEKLGTDDVRLRAGRVESTEDAVDIGELAALAPESTDGNLRLDLQFVEKRVEPYWAGSSQPNISPSYTFAAHAVEVEVDPDTGQLRIVDYVAAHDIGQAINPALVEGQIVGGVVQGLGAVLGEQLIYEGGRVVNTGYVHYPMPRATTAPSVRAVLIEGPEEAGPFNAKSVGEMSIVPPAPAILNAVYAATGIRFREVPLTPDVVLSALRAREDAPRHQYPLWRRPSRWQIEAFRRLYPLGLHWALHRVGTRFARRRLPRPIESLVTPTTVADAIAALGSAPPGEVAVVGGGSDLLVQRQQQLANPRIVVSTSEVPDMRRLEAGGGEPTVIGAAVTLRELADRADELAPMIADAVRTIASAQLREVATVGGNLAQAKRCWFFRNGFDCYKRGGVTCPCYAVTGDHRFHHAVVGAHRCQAVTPSDLATVFAAYDARVSVAGPSGMRRLAIGELYSGPGELALAGDELITSVSIGAGELGRRAVFEKLRLWDGDFAVVSLAATTDVGPDGRWKSPRLVFGGLAALPWSPAEALSTLDGTRPTPADVVAAVDTSLSRHAHPLRSNGWKVEAALGLTRKVAHRLIAPVEGTP